LSLTGQSYALLEARGVVALTGAEARAFLQGMISKDVDQLSPSRALYGGLLTPQGKYLHDFFVVESGASVLLDCERARIDDLIDRLNRFRLRAAVEIADRSANWQVAALWGGGPAPFPGLGRVPGAAKPYEGGVVMVDPRLTALGLRAILPRPTGAASLAGAGFAAAAEADYDRLRLGLGVADGSRDMMVEKSFLLEGNFEALNGVDFDKGCYVGQENTARQKHRDKVRKQLMRVDVKGPLPEPGTPIMLGKREVGVMRSGRESTGIALLRVASVGEALARGEALSAGAAVLTPVEPAWASD
jgi:hypothetical protein|tara:strand:- start:255 stop:1160 length:906 start_codon:yes stop_codon:yes gene_type:complete